MSLNLKLSNLTAPDLLYIEIVQIWVEFMLINTMFSEELYFEDLCFLRA